MEGIQVRTSKESLETIMMGPTEINLLASHAGLEVMLQTINKDNMFYVYPGDNNEVSEFIYLLNGFMSVEIDDSIMELKAGDYCFVNGLKNPVHFSTKTDVTFLWIITEQTFFILSNEIDTLKDFVYQVEKKDRYTFLHSDRVAKYCMKIAKKLKLSKEQLKSLLLAGGYHDVGKIKVPEEILNKPGRLTNEEFDIIKKHPEDSAKMIKHIYSGRIPDIILQHHERLNGSGYPKGLRDDEILLEAKIIAVADTFDAMTEDRAYRKAFTPEYAIEELKKMSGTHYDESVVSAFEAVLIEEGIIKK
ncbi:HD domain-containing phosphohydrolase [Peribacillus sp. SCS-37]|uniref:HD domain-containing phosphohydrolase n=1 Tax=Paraperibacillus esterisolvens TaxID=3115296 RepID=UPI003905C3BD